MKIKAIFFDLDGTLLPMDQEVFVKAYIGGLARVLAPLGYKPEDVATALWKGTKDMMKNDGTARNDEVFWQGFGEILGDDIRKEESRLDEFYKGDFQLVRNVCGYTDRSKRLVDSLKARGFTVVLATSPLFPTIATESRIRWAGLEPEDFAYVTTYENSYFCKPNPLYYTDLAEKMGLKPEEVLMVGNDVGDDMVAGTVGMKLFLLTDCLINKADRDLSDFPHGDFDALEKYLEEIL